MQAAELPDGTREVRRVVFTEDDCAALDAVMREVAWVTNAERERWNAGR
ncbi:MAG: hypothetical protein U1F29_06990 [Planctomycetota bacterium]